VYDRGDSDRRALANSEIAAPRWIPAGYAAPMSTFHDFVLTSITGEPIALSTYAGTACLVVNVASA
jgi:hypothetical protein